MRRNFGRALMLALLAICVARLGAAEPVWRFRDVSDETGIRSALRGAMCHAAAWGDADGDGQLDLFVGTFADRPASEYEAGGADGPVPNRLFIQRQGKFVLSHEPPSKWLGRASGAIFADLDNDGRPELYVSNNGRLGHQNLLYQNLGGGRFVEAVQRAAAPLDRPETARSATVLDFDGDGLLDLLVLGTVGRDRTYLFRNRGGLRFEVSDAIPADATGLGVAVGDLTGNGWPDVLIGGPNRLFVNLGGGRFREATEAGIATQFKREDDAESCGVALGDFDRDGLMDIAVGSHTKAPWRSPVPVRLYRNLGSTPQHVRLEEVSGPAGIQPYPIRTPHVELRDFDNDGWLDLYTAVVTLRGEQVWPAIYRNLGRSPDGGVRLEESAFVMRRDFPGEDDFQPGERSGAFYDRLVRNRKVMYFAAGPSSDYDGDGRLDLMLASWFPTFPSMLLRNETAAGHYLDVQIVGSGRVNAMGIGTIVRAYRPGQAGQPAALLASDQVATGYGYCSGQAPIAHLGLGTVTRCDLVIALPCGQGTVTRENVAVNQRLIVRVP